MKIRQLESYSTGNPQSYPQLLGITLGQLNINDLQQSAKNIHPFIQANLIITSYQYEKVHYK